MYRTLFITGLLCCAAPGYSALTHIKQDLFKDTKANLKVQYPCAMGGEPLVIYSTYYHNNKLISSREPLYPIYTAPQFKASALTIGEGSASDSSSFDHFIVNTNNPGTSYDYVTFALQRNDQKDFYVNTANLGIVDVQDEDQYVSSYQVNINGKPFVQSHLPIRMMSFDQSWGAYIESNVKSIQIYQYAWNQKGKWFDSIGNLRPRHPIAYNVKIEPSESSKTYNGYGFWICGSDEPSQLSAELHDEPYFTDKKH